MTQPMYFEQFFQRATKSIDHEGFQPRGWQRRLAADETCRSRLIRIPTGEGKTLGALSAWLFHRVETKKVLWPMRLVWCLPMRTLVEQTVNEARKLLETLGMMEQVSVHELMGGCDERRWYDNPDRPAILVGTQDMLLSRAMNRGYAMGRAAWPRAFGLLNTDCLWVMDEIQLMGVGLTTSCQIQAFFEDSPSQSLISRTRATWWMSATLQPNWLRTPETGPMIEKLRQEIVTIQLNEQSSEQWSAAKPLERLASDPANWAQRVKTKHDEATADPKTGKQTLVVLNTVKSAMEMYDKVKKSYAKEKLQPEIRLIHSRFRPAERENWIEDFLSRKSLNPETNRILVATQVVEAGVDISATSLLTELAPWPSLVQRFGRAARYGGSAKIVVLDPQYIDDKKSAPYKVAELDAARNAIDKLAGVSIADLQSFEQKSSEEEIATLYPFDPVHVLLPSEFEELFDTSPDLSGADVDIARFIREGDEKNVMVFWRDWKGVAPPPDLRPQRRELCSVPILNAKDWLTKVDFKQKWTWDYLDGAWVDADAKSLRPGQVILVRPSVGGYDPLLGFTGEKASKGGNVVAADTDMDSLTEGDLSESNEDLSAIEVWKTICTHCREAGELAASKCDSLSVPASIKKIVVLALQLHDWGKCHPAFAKGTYRVDPLRTDLAKAPPSAWRKGKQLYVTQTYGPRSGFRHELASMLAVIEILRMACPDHAAILGPYREMLTACGLANEQLGQEGHNWKTHPIAMEVQALTANEFNLLLYLIVSHHGKVRCSLQSSPKDQDFPIHVRSYEGAGMPIRGVRERDQIPSTLLPRADGTPVEMPAITLSLDIASMGLSTLYGASWIERVQGIQSYYGVFAIAWLEALVRAIDGWSSSDSQPPGNTADPLIDGRLEVPNIDGVIGQSSDLDSEGELQQAAETSEEIAEESNV